MDLQDDRDFLFSAEAGDLIVEEVVSGNGSIVKGGPGILTVSAICSYTGDTRILDGVLQIDIDDALPSGTSLIIDAGAILDLNGHNLTVETLDNQGTIINSSCQEVILTVADPPQSILVPGNGSRGLAAIATQWMKSICAAPDWCMGADRDQDGFVNLDDLEYLAINWLQCE